VCTQFGEPAFERKPNRTARYLATARAAFAAAGVDDFPRHVLVATTPEFVFLTSTILLKREPFTDAEVAAFRETAAALPASRIRPAPGDPPGDNPVTKVASLAPDALRRWYADYPFDVRPVTDDAPFFWHFVPFRSALARVPPREAGALEEGMGERLLV